MEGHRWEVVLPDGSKTPIDRNDFSFMENGKPVKSSYKVKPCDVLTVMMDRPRYDNDIIPEDIPFYGSFVIFYDTLPILGNGNETMPEDSALVNESGTAKS